MPVISTSSIPRVRSHPSSVVPSADLPNSAECTCLYNTSSAASDSPVRVRTNPDSAVNGSPASWLSSWWKICSTGTPAARQRSLRRCTLAMKAATSLPFQYGRWRKDSWASMTSNACFMGTPGDCLERTHHRGYPDAAPAGFGTLGDQKRTAGAPRASPLAGPRQELELGLHADIEPASEVVVVQQSGADVVVDARLRVHRLGPRIEHVVHAKPQIDGVVERPVAERVDLVVVGGALQSGDAARRRPDVGQVLPAEADRGTPESVRERRVELVAERGVHRRARVIDEGRAAEGLHGIFLQIASDDVHREGAGNRRSHVRRTHRPVQL